MFEGFVASCFRVFYPVSEVSIADDGVFRFNVLKDGKNIPVFVLEGGKPPSEKGVIIDINNHENSKVDAVLSVRGGSIQLLKDLLSRGVYGVIPSKSHLSFLRDIEANTSIVMMDSIPILHVFMVYKVRTTVSSGLLFKKKRVADGFVVVDPLCFSPCVIRKETIKCFGECMNVDEGDIDLLIKLSDYSKTTISEDKLAKIISSDELYKLSINRIIKPKGKNYYVIPELKPPINPSFSFSRIESIPIDWSNFSFSCSNKFLKMIHTVDKYIEKIYDVHEKYTLLYPFIAILPIPSTSNIRVFNAVTLEEDNYFSKLYTLHKNCVVRLMNEKR